MSYRVGPPPPPWRWEIIVDFVLSATGAGALLVSAAHDWRSGEPRLFLTGAWVASACLAVSLLMLVLDLGRPARFWRMLSTLNPRSVMSWGAWILNGCFAVALGGSVATVAGAAPALWRALLAGALVFAPLVLVYKGMLLSVTAVPLWRTGRLFGPLFLVDGISVGAILLGQGRIASYAMVLRVGLMLLVYAAAGQDRALLARRWTWWVGFVPLVGSVLMRAAILRAPYAERSA